MKRKLLQKLVPGLCASLVLVSATSLTGCSTDTKTAATTSDVDKSETVYVKADASGTINEIKVQTDLKNNGTSNEIKDFSTLKDIKNTKGNESFTQSSDGTITWENKGEDIHYEGTSTEELPVNVKISYTLDGKSIQPEDLSGKSGKLGIRFDYKNTTEENVTINGEEMTSPVPFAVISAMILPEDTASNIQVTNGKIFTMNDQSVVVGYACPGLKDSLKLTDYEPTEDISIPESVEVTADVTNFEMDFTATVVSSGLFEDLEDDSFDDMEDAADSLQELGDASGKLADGAAQLLGGASTYQTYLGQYVDGVTALNENSGKLVSGASSLQNGLEQLNSALSGQISTDSGSLPSAETLSALQEQIKSLSQQLDSVDSSLAEAKSSFASVNWDTLKSSITEDAKEQSKTAATDAVQSTIDQIVSETASDSELSEESKNAVNDKMSQLKNEINDTIASAIDQNLDLSSSTTDIDQLKSATEGTLNSLTELIASCHTTLDQMSSGAGSFAEAMQSLSSLSETLKTLQNSLSALSAGSLQLTQGLTSFQQGISQLSEGSSTLSQGATKLGTAGKELKEGYTTLAEGISSISEGLTLFDKEGIQELEKLGGDDLKNLSKRMKAVKEADAEYDNYGGKLEEQTGEVRFIIETDGID